MQEINWKLFSDLHALTNEYTILSEELSDNYYANLQIVKEERDAYSHMCSAFTKSDFAKQKEQFDFALSHQYRALYDAMDWLCIVYRKQIDRQIRRNKSVLKDRNIAMEIKEISVSISDCRINKDMIHDSTSTEEAITPGIKKYKTSINKLEEIYNLVLGK